MRCPIRRFALGLILAALITQVACLMSGGKMQFCIKCHSTRLIEFRNSFGLFQVITKSTVKRMSAGYATCSHKWVDGISPGYHSMVTYPGFIQNNRVLLIHQHEKYAAVILRTPKTSPETSPDDITTFDWWYRSDGKGTFDSTDSAVFSGHSKDTAIRFADFKVEWSAMDSDEGYLYLFHPMGTISDPDDAFLCITQETSVAHIDACDPKWKYL